MVIDVNDNNFKQEVLKKDLLVLVDFWAEWCAPCRMVAPSVESIANKYKDKLKVCKLNVDEAPQTASIYNIMSIPTLALFKNGGIADKIVGAIPEVEIETVIKPYFS